MEFLSRLLADISRRDSHGFDALLATGLDDVDRMFMKDHRIVVGIRDAPTALLRRGSGNGARRGFIGKRIHLAGLAHVPILAELA
jgi:hypothetical protein